MRSRQTGQVGSSMRFGVGGGKGLRDSVAPLGMEGVKGSWLKSGKLSLDRVGVSNVMDRMNAMVHVSGSMSLNTLPSNSLLNI